MTNRPGTTEAADAWAADGDDPAAAFASAEPALRAFARRMVGGGVLRQELDDVVQDTFARALRGAAGFDPERPLAPWLFGICARVVADRHRARRASGAATLEGAVAADAIDPGAVDGLRAFDARDELERRLRALPRSDRELLLAFHRDGRSVAELARAAGAPTGTIKSRLSRARRALAELVEREDAR